jgi:hypothetical protein
MKNAPSDQTKSILDSKDTSAHTQRLQILSHIRRLPLNTLELRELRELRELGHMAPAPRTKELRNKGFIIVTSFESVTDELGKLHRRVVRYKLVYEPPANDINSGLAA